MSTVWHPDRYTYTVKERYLAYFKKDRSSFSLIVLLQSNNLVAVIERIRM